MTLLYPAKKSGRKFLNPIPTTLGGPSMLLEVLMKYLTNREQRTPPTQPGPFTTDLKVFHKAPESGLRVTWFGHSSTLLEIDGARLLIDPIWEGRASPIRWMGPKRFFRPTLQLDQLPSLDVVLLSHDHYDHLGAATVRSLARLRQTSGAIWVTSRGVGDLLRQFGVAAERTVELDWTQRHDSLIRGRRLAITSWPARHFSGRRLTNRFGTLWASFAIEGEEHSVFYGADSGPWPGFAEIGERHGRFDLTMLEIGAYDPMWADIHLGPDAAAAAFQSMKAGGMLMPIHWGLFDLALHAWTQPIERLRFLACEQGIPLWSPEPGRPTEVVRGVPVLSDWWMGPSG